MSNEDIKKEQLRREVLDYIYAGAFSGIPAMILDESEVQNASYEELEEIAERYGIKYCMLMIRYTTFLYNFKTYFTSNSIILQNYNKFY